MSPDSRCARNDSVTGAREHTSEPTRVKPLNRQPAARVGASDEVAQVSRLPVSEGVPPRTPCEFGGKTPPESAGETPALRLWRWPCGMRRTYTGKDAFHRAPYSAGEATGALERLLTRTAANRPPATEIPTRAQRTQRRPPPGFATIPCPVRHLPLARSRFALGSYQAGTQPRAALARPLSFLPQPSAFSLHFGVALGSHWGRIGVALG